MFSCCTTDSGQAVGGWVEEVVGWWGGDICRCGMDGWVGRLVGGLVGEGVLANEGSK